MFKLWCEWGTIYARVFTKRILVNHALVIVYCLPVTLGKSPNVNSSTGKNINCSLKTKFFRFFFRFLCAFWRLFKDQEIKRNVRVRKRATSALPKSKLYSASAHRIWFTSKSRIIKFRILLYRVFLTLPSPQNTESICTEGRNVSKTQSIMPLWSSPRAV